MSVFLWDVKINIPIGGGISTQAKYLIIFLTLKKKLKHFVKSKKIKY